MSNDNSEKNISKCKIGNLSLSEYNYSNTRKENLQKLINKYQELSSQLIEIENISPQEKKRYLDNIDDLNKKILDLQNKLFKNNDKSLNNINKQKKRIKHKNNAIVLNKEILIKQNDMLNKNDALAELAKTQVTESGSKNKDIDKKFLYLSILCFLFIVIGFVLILLYKEKPKIPVNDNIGVY